eukprot:gene932-9840_t
MFENQEYNQIIDELSFSNGLNLKESIQNQEKIIKEKMDSHDIFDYFKMTNSLNENMNFIQKDFSKNPKNKQEKNNLLIEEKENQKVLEYLKRIKLFQNNFKKYETFLEQSDFLNAFKNLRENEDLLKENSNLNHLKIYNEIEIENSIKKEKFFNIVSKQFEYKFTEEKEFIFNFTLNSNDFWFLLSKNDQMLTRLIKTFTKKIEENIFVVFNENLTFKENDTGFTLKNDQFKSFNDFFDSNLKLFQFFKEKIFLSQKDSISIFWSNISSNFIKYIKKIILYHFKVEKNVHKIQEEIEIFENNFKRLMNIEKEEILKNLNLNKKIRDDQLNFVRNLFNQEITIENIDESNKGTIFYFPKCKISNSCKQFIKKIKTENNNQILKEMFDLYLLLLEKKNITYLNMIMYNDCIFISHHLFILSFQNKKEYHLYFEYFKLFKQFGNDLISSEIEFYILEFIDMFSNVSGLFNSILSNNKKIEITFKKINDQILKLKKNWGEILPRNLFLILVGKILSILMNEIFDEIIKLNDISEKDSSEIIYFLNYFMKNLIIFSEEDDLNVYIGNFKKFKSLILILDMRMKDILIGLKNSKIQDISKKEINHLIEALFEDSNIRDDVLAEIEGLDI